MKISTLAMVGFSLLALGCQGGQAVKSPSVDNGGFMGLWNTYAHCQSSANLEELRKDSTLLTSVAMKTTVPGGFVVPLPGKLEKMVTTPSARLAVDVKAMAASCALRAGQVAVSLQKFDEATPLLQGILANHPESDYAYYVSQAKSILASMNTVVVQVTLNKLP